MGQRSAKETEIKAGRLMQWQIKLKQFQDPSLLLNSFYEIDDGKI